MKNYIKQLRSKFKKYEIDGYVIPKNDDYFTEYSKLNRFRQRDISRLEADASSSALKATSAASAVRNMEILDAIYDASGLGARPGRAQPLCNGANS